jgi:hypothetical protein
METQDQDERRGRCLLRIDQSAVTGARRLQPRAELICLGQAGSRSVVHANWLEVLASPVKRPVSGGDSPCDQT